LFTLVKYNCRTVLPDERELICRHEQGNRTTCIQMRNEAKYALSIGMSSHITTFNPLVKIRNACMRTRTPIMPPDLALLRLGSSCATKSNSICQDSVLTPDRD